MIEYQFTKGGYDFYKSSDDCWNVVKQGEPPPKHCAYRLEAIALLKGVKL